MCGGALPTSRTTAPVVATPHHLASEAGRAVLAAGGNAVDAAIAANLALGIVTPYCCGPGGDLFAIVWDGRAHGYHGAGRAAAGVTRDELAAELRSMPFFGPHSVTVPGAVDGWFTLLERWGTRSFGDLAASAIALADDGYTVSGTRRIRRQPRGSATTSRGPRSTGRSTRGRTSANPRPRTLRALADDGPTPSIADRSAPPSPSRCRTRVVTLRRPILPRTREWCDPYAARFRDLDILELPPPTQGATVLEALRILDGCAIPRRRRAHASRSRP